MTTGLAYLEVQNYLQQLKLCQAQTALDRLADEASKNEWSYIDFLDKLLSEEITARQGRRLTLKQRLAHFSVLTL
jgi:DNA replication protein DnaC